jgi:spermidine synthase
VALGGLLLLSGAAGLIYQVAWVRLLGLAFGVTLYAISTVLAAFMGGLALGSLVGGRRADRLLRPLLWYGLVELGVGVTALLTPGAFGVLQDVYAAVARVADPDQAPLLAGVVRAALAFGVLLVPTGLMGASLPLAVRGARAWLSAGEDATRWDTLTMGGLYALNTTGAIVGTLVSGFVLIGGLGLHATILAAAGCNLAAGLGAIVLAQFGRIPTARGESVARTHSGGVQGGNAPGARPRARSRPSPLDPRLARAAFVAFGVSGGISLAYEVVWTRTLAILFDSSIYGFVLMLATVLLGIALGGGVAGALLGWRSARPTLAGLAFGWIEIGIGLAAVLALVAFGGAYDFLLGLRDAGPTLLVRLVRTDLRLMAMLCVLTVLPAALLMGATFPVASRLWAAGSHRVGSRLGGVYAANVAGAIVGSLAAGFLLVPALGAHHALLLLAAVNVALGVFLLQAATQAMWPLLAGAAALAVIGWGALRPPLHETVFHAHFPDQALLAYWEGRENTVSVGRDAGGVQTLFTNSRGQTNDAPDLVRYHRVMGHLAALLSPHADAHALVVGLGAGATPGATAQHNGSRVDVVELSESVIDAAPFFRAANYGVLDLPNVHLTIDDGRNFLLRNRQAYDVITADVVHPYDAGATNLYSVEYFRLAARALDPHGIMVQWVSPGSAFEHSLIVRTFLQAFPNATLWLTGDLLIGSPSPLQVSRADLERRLADPSARASLAEVGFLKPEDVLAQFRADSTALHAYAGSGPVLTDDRPLLEYFASLHVPPDPPDLAQFHSNPAAIETP